MLRYKGWRPSLGLIGWVSPVATWPLTEPELGKQLKLVAILDTLSRADMALLPSEPTYVEVYRWWRRN